MDCNDWLDAGDKWITKAHFNVGGGVSVSVREARPGDGPALHRLICALAEHHEELDRVVSTPKQLEAVLCVPAAHRGCLVAETGGEVVGLAYWYEVFTTFAARNKLYLEDIVVSHDARGAGAGQALMQRLAQICLERGYPRFEWLAMHDNTAGQRFYARLGGKVREGAETWQLAEDRIKALAKD